MEEKTYKFWDMIIKALGFTATIASILIGLFHYSSEQTRATDLEFRRNFWQKQNELYAEVCRNAGTMAAASDQKEFEKQKEKFLSLYYGELVLVEDSLVENAMREVKSYVEILDTKDENMKNIFKRKVLELSEACKRSSDVFKHYNLK